jgi:hypothetical protein
MEVAVNCTASSVVICHAKWHHGDKNAKQEKRLLSQVWSRAIRRTAFTTVFCIHHGSEKWKRIKKKKGFHVVNKQRNSVALCLQLKYTDWPQHPGENSAKFAGRGVSRGQRNGSPQLLILVS